MCSSDKFYGAPDFHNAKIRFKATSLLPNEPNLYFSESCVTMMIPELKIAITLVLEIDVILVNLSLIFFETPNISLLKHKW